MSILKKISRPDSKPSVIEKKVNRILRLLRKGKDHQAFKLCGQF